MMMNPLPKHFVIEKTLAQAQRIGTPVVALESTVITHGLPRPGNLNLAREMEAAVRDHGAAPATIAVLDGKIHIGLGQDELERLAGMTDTRKISMRDFGIALAGELSGGTTVAATLYVASQAGIRVFATGGIGGVHRGAPFDVSADLNQLGNTPVLVVCAGAKAILDLPATREVLETRGVPVIGYRTDAFPAFYTRDSGLTVDQRIETPEEAADIALAAWEAGLSSAILLVVPPPAEAAMDEEEMESAILEALAKAEEEGVHGAETTPYLLAKVSELTGGVSLRANLALLKNNAQVAAQVSGAMFARRKAGLF